MRTCQNNSYICAELTHGKLLMCNLEQYAFQTQNFDEANHLVNLICIVSHWPKSQSRAASELSAFPATKSSIMQQWYLRVWMRNDCPSSIARDITGCVAVFMGVVVQICLCIVCGGCAVGRKVCEVLKILIGVPERAVSISEVSNLVAFLCQRATLILQQ